MEELNKTIGGIYPDNLSLTDIVGEEIIHAMILVNLMDSNEEPARLDQEFEAKSIRGIVKSEAGLPTTTRPDEKFAEEVGVRYFNQGSINDYSNDMESWRNIENNPYKNFISNNSTPKLLQRIVSKEQKRGK